MDINNLVVMANRIGDFFESMPDRDEAKKDIASHILKFWEPRMRLELISKMDHFYTESLHDIVRDAVVENKWKLFPK